MDLSGRRVTIMGLGRHGGGTAAARFAVQSGARVVVTDTAPKAALADSLAEVAGLPIERFQFGGHCEDDFRDAELVVVNPAVPPANGWLQFARQQGALLTSEMELFLHACPAQLIGVTGSNGKSTTSAMTATILTAAGRRVWLGGNIGHSLLGDLGAMQPEDWVIVELSSFQLAQLADGQPIPPELQKLTACIVTNCSPNHLDWHGDYEHYQSAKQRIVECVAPGGAVLFNTADAEVSKWALPTHARTTPPVADGAIPWLAVPGEHNRSNARCAAAAARVAGCDAISIAQGLASFTGLPHRLALVGEVAGRKFYNDSMATTPESVIAALSALKEPIWLLAGGKEKGSEFAALADAIVKCARGVCFYGTAREKLSALVQSRLAAHASERQIGHGVFNRDVGTCETLPEALEWCFARTRAGDALLLSPACASYDRFRDYIDRAEAFVAAMHALQQRWRNGNNFDRADESTCKADDLALDSESCL